MRKAGIAILCAICILSIAVPGLEDTEPSAVQIENETNYTEIDPGVGDVAGMDDVTDPCVSPENQTVSDTSGDSIVVQDTISENAEPVIIYAWVQDDSGLLEDGDADHLAPGGQFLPPCQYGAGKSIQIRAVLDIAAAEGMGVNASLYSPDGVLHSRIFLAKEMESDALGLFEAASDANLTEYAGGWTGDVSRGFADSTVSLMKGAGNLSYSDPAGNYSVVIIAGTGNDTPSLLAVNFTYVPVACCEFDFSHIDYGTVEPNVRTVVPGDDSFGTSDKPTVRNIGNVPVRIRIRQDSMGFDRSESGLWNIEYGVRFGAESEEILYYPDEEVIAPVSLPVDMTEQIDFSVRVLGGSGDNYGILWLGYMSDTG